MNTDVPSVWTGWRWALGAVVLSFSELSEPSSVRTTLQLATLVVAIAAAAFFRDRGARFRWNPAALMAVLLVIAAVSARSGALAVLAIVAALGSLAGQRVAFIVVTALAALGIATAGLHCGDLLPSGAQYVVGRVVAVLAGGAVVNDHALIHGHQIHLGWLSPWSAVVPIAAVLAWARVPFLRAAPTLLAALVAASALRLAIVVTLIGVEVLPWIANPLFDAAIAAFVTAGAALLVEGMARRCVPHKSHRTFIVAAAAGVTLWAILWPSHPSAPRAVRVLLDDAHGEWETSRRSFDRQEYGRHTVYTYDLLRRWLERRHKVEVEVALPLKPRGEVIVIKTPALPYSPEERRALTQFVTDGGGVVAIGDHTNLFGTTDNLNETLRPSGLRLRSDAVIPLQGITSVIRAQWWNASPILPVGGRWETQTAASISGRGIFTRAILVDPTAVAEDAEYSNERNFGPLRPSWEDRRGPIVVAAEARVGRGRIVLLGDSTPWSNFSFFAPPNKEILDSAIRLAADRHNRWAEALAVALFVIVFMAAVVLSREPITAIGVTFATYALVGAMSTSHVELEATRARGDTPDSTIILDGALGPLNWDTDIRTSSLGEREVFSAFLSWISRFGVDPEVLNTNVYADPQRPVLVLNPSRPVTAAVAAAVDRFVRDGGRLLVLDDPDQRPGTTSPALLRPFGISYQVEVLDRPVHKAAGPIVPEVFWALPLTLLSLTRAQPGEVLVRRTTPSWALGGVEPLWVDDQGLVIYGRKVVGNGEVRAFIRSSMFSQLTMGDVWGGVEPGADKTALYDLEYELLDFLKPPKKSRLATPLTK